MKVDIGPVLDYAKGHHEAFVQELKALLRIPSISTDPAYKDEVNRAAKWLAQHMEQLGVTSARPVATTGHPVVLGQYLVDPAFPTVLVYGHYDVQPPDPIELWDSPPFEPQLRGGDLYARGASDDKGQLLIHLKALEAYVRTVGRPPLNLKYIFEGEEESGSPSIPEVLEAHADELAADVVLLSDTTLFSRGVPSLTYGLRGLAYVEITLTGPSRDLHSGTFGGAIENPANALCRLISGLHDEDHRISVPRLLRQCQGSDGRRASLHAGVALRCRGMGCGRRSERHEKRRLATARSRAPPHGPHWIATGYGVDTQARVPRPCFPQVPAPRFP